MSNNEILDSSPEVMYEIGSGYPSVVINVGTHGNESLPVEAARQFTETFNEADLVCGSLKIIVSNPLALKAGKRFLDTDLNRAYPGVSLEAAFDNFIGSIGSSQPMKEVLIAHEVLGLIGDADYVIDLHTAPDPPPFTVLGARDKARLELAEIAPVKNIVLFEAPAEPCAMVDFTKCGIGIEIGGHEEDEALDRGVLVIEQYLQGLGLVAASAIPSLHHDYYKVFQACRKEEVPKDVLSELANFKPISSDRLGLEIEEAIVFPVLCGDKVCPPGSYYPFTLLAKKVTREYLAGIGG